MKKHVFYTEIAFIAGIVLIAAGVMFMEKADFGVSMVVAPAYIIYRKINLIWSGFTFGMAEYCLQALLIVIIGVVVRKFRLKYLLSFATAVIYGMVLDGFMALGMFLPDNEFWQRLLYYVIGIINCAAGVSMMFHTYLYPEAYELFVKEISAHFGLNINKFKIAYDCVSCVIGILMSMLLFGVHNFVGVNWGTILCAAVNGVVISCFSSLYQSIWEFKDAFTWRTFFEEKEEVRSVK